MLGSLKRTAKMTESGIGLGFNVSRKLVDIYDGRLRIHSNRHQQYVTIVEFSMKFEESESS